MLPNVKWKLLGLLLVVVAVGAAALWFTHRTISPKDPTWQDAVAEAKNRGYRLLNTNEFQQLLAKDPKSVLIVDTRSEWEYAQEHIPGAVNFPIDTNWWSRLRKSGALEAALGPNKNRMIVFYCDGFT